MEFSRHGVPESQRQQLAAGPLQRWGRMRWSQVLGLWTFLGDGHVRPVATSNLQIWGPAGTGKTSVVADYLDTFRLRHIWLNCAGFTSRGELNARIIELIRREVAASAPHVQDLQQRFPIGRQVRSLDRLEAALRLPLEHLSQTPSICTEGSGAAGNVRVVIVLDQAQELQRLGEGTMEFLTSLPEVLQRGDLLSLLFIGRLPLSSSGFFSSREPDSVAFPSYSETEAQAVLSRALASTYDNKETCSSTLMKFAAPYVGNDMRLLKGVGLEFMSQMHAGNGSLNKLKELVEDAVDRRLGSGSLKGWMPEIHSEAGATAACVLATLRQLTQAEMRLLVASFLASHVAKEDDAQLFLNANRSRQGSRKKAKAASELPIEARPPKPSCLTRVFAIYHHLARRTQLLGPDLFQLLAGLREGGLLRFNGDRASVDNEAKIVCRAELPLVRECAREIGVDLCEYLMHN